VQVRLFQKGKTSNKFQVDFGKLSKKIKTINSPKLTSNLQFCRLNLTKN